MPDPWLPEEGSPAGMIGGSLVVARSEDHVAHRISAVDGAVRVERLEGSVLADAVRLPPVGSGEPPTFADGSRLPPFDEAPILASQDYVERADAVGVLDLTDSPFGDRSFEYTFVNGQLDTLRMIPRLDTQGMLGRTPPNGLDITWSVPWGAWCHWRAGRLTGEQLLENARIAGTWPYIALVQGLFEDDTFRRERQALPEVPDDLALLALVKWS